jgi:peptide/nickel transport system permease protein
MTQYIARRLIAIIPSMLLLLLMVVVMVRMIPGNVVDILLQEQGGAGSEKEEIDRAELEQRLGLDDPIIVQYFEYLAGLLTGDLGESLWNQQPVAELVWQKFPVTAEVAVIAVIVSITIAIPVGVFSAVKQDSAPDYVVRSASILSISLPNFAIATAIVIFPALWWGWSVPFRYVTFWEDPSTHLALVLPAAAVLGIQLSGTLARMTRTMMLEVMQQDYMRTARAKGLASRLVIFRHGLRNALIPVVTLLGLQVSFLIGGSVITETVFALPGLGRLMIGAIQQRDYPVIQGIVIVVGIFVMLTNLFVDLAYGYLDPRVRARYA